MKGSQYETSLKKWRRRTYLPIIACIVLLIIAFNVSGLAQLACALGSAVCYMLFCRLSRPKPLTMDFPPD